MVEPGYQQQVALGRGARDEGDLRAIQVLAQRGATARGRVVDDAGRGVAASVRLHRWVVEPERRWLRAGGSARLLADGWFELHVREPVAGGVLLADAGNAGTAALEGVTIALENAPAGLHLVARGEGVLRGRLLDRAGEPAAGVALLVLLSELDDERGSFVLPEPTASLRSLDGLGRTWLQLASDERGAFEVRGLRPEAYVVRARTGPVHDGYPQLLTPRPAPANGAELVLEVAHPHVVVRLLDAAGRPWLPPEDAATGELRPGADTLAWPERPLVRAFACEGREDGPCLAGRALKVRSTSSSQHVLDATEGARYLVSVLGGGFDGAPLEVEVPPGSDRVVAEVRARPASELGCVAVRVAYLGEPQEGSEPSFDLRLQTLVGQVPLRSRSGARLGSTVVFRAPAGPYRVVAEGTPVEDPHHGYVWSARALGRSEAEVELRAGLTQDLALAIDAGGNLAVSLAGEITAADRRALQDGDPRLGVDEQDRAHEASRAELTLHHADRGPERVFFQASAGAGVFSEVLLLRADWPLGATQLSARLPTGRYTLVGRLPGGREARAEVELRAGETTAVTLRF